MELLNIKTYPDDVLEKKADLITNINGNLQNFINNMAHTMYEAQGVGLAAPQVGISRRVIVYDINSKSEKKKFNTLINPEIISMNKKIISENEGCLSIPNFRADVKRFDEIIVKGVDRNEKIIHIETKGILSIVLQHEIDHLNGTLFINHISTIKRQIYKKRVAKQLRIKRQ